MPELPQMLALAERLEPALLGTELTAIDSIGFSGLKSVLGDANQPVGRSVVAVSQRGKFLVVLLDGGSRILVHLSQAGRIDLERPRKNTRPRGSVVRFSFDNGAALLVREYGSERKAGWWALESGDDGPLGALGPEPFDREFETKVLESDESRHLHTVLRDQRFVAGVGRGYADDALNRAGLSPFSSLRALDPVSRHELVEAVRAALRDGLTVERQRTGGLSEAKLGTNFAVHNRKGRPCPRCARELLVVSYSSHEVVYCPSCQTNGRILADRRMSKLLR